MAKLTEADLKGFVEELTEARKLLANKAKVEHEIAVAEKHLGRVRDEDARVDAGLTKKRQDIAQAEATFSYEKKRYEAELGRLVGECGAKKIEAEKDLASSLQAFDKDVHSYRATSAAERANLTAEVLALRKEKETLFATIRQFKSQINALPE